MQWMGLVLAAVASTPVWPCGGEEGNFGARIASIGDIDKDKVPDLAVSDPLAKRGGRVFLFSGKTGKVLRTLRSDIEVSWMGKSLCGPGDLDGDGTPDVLVGAELAEKGSDNRLGTVIVFSGATGKRIREYPQTVPENGFGTFLATFGDYNGDGSLDFLVSAPTDSPGGLENAGAVYLLSGKDDQTLVRIVGGDHIERLGESMAAVGDMDGDGVGDIAASGKLPTGQDRFVRVFSGKTRKTIFTLKGFSTMAWGVPIAATGDLNGDGKSDLVVTDALHPRGTQGVFGMARAYSGANGEVLWTTYGKAKGDMFGYAAVGAGDVDGDNVGDVAVAGGFGFEESEMADRIHIAILSGRTGVPIRTVRPPENGEFFLPDDTLAMVGDLDGDRKPEIAVRTSLPSGPSGNLGKTRIRVFAGKDGKCLLTLQEPLGAEDPVQPPK